MTKKQDARQGYQTMLIAEADGRLHCPHCAYDTQLTQRMAAHLRKKHGETWEIVTSLVLTTVQPAPEPATAEDTPQEEPADKL